MLTFTEYLCYNKLSEIMNKENILNENLTKKNTKKILSQLNDEFKKNKKNFTITIFGSLPLILSGIINRGTDDIDMIFPIDIEKEMKDEIKTVRKNNKDIIGKHWLNSLAHDSYKMFFNVKPATDNLFKY